MAIGTPFKASPREGTRTEYYLRQTLLFKRNAFQLRLVAAGGGGCEGGLYAEIGRASCRERV